MSTQLTTIARTLYHAGRWTLPPGSMADATQAALWAELRDALGIEEGTATVEGSGHIPASIWQSPDVPEGYQTVVGWFDETQPGLLDLMGDPHDVVKGTRGDGSRMRAACRTFNRPPVKVTPPPAMSHITDVKELNAYPRFLLERTLPR